MPAQPQHSTAEHWHIFPLTLFPESGSHGKGRTQNVPHSCAHAERSCVFMYKDHQQPTIIPLYGNSRAVRRSATINSSRKPAGVLLRACTAMEHPVLPACDNLRNQVCRTGSLTENH
jgi:hypothetical protein